MSRPPPTSIWSRARTPIARLARAARSLRRRATTWPRVQPVALECGVTLLADRHDQAWDRLARQGHHERDAEAFLTAFLEDGDVAVDVGAHVGMLCALMASRVGPSGQVLAFEPDPRNRAALRRSIARHGHGRRVEVHDTALSDSDGAATLLRPDGAWGAFLAGPDGRADAVRGFFHSSVVTTHAIETARLDTFLRSHRVDRIDLIKVDVDGPEVAILRGAAATLRAHQPAVIVEASAFYSDHGVRPADVLELLDAHGYTVWAARRGDRGYQHLSAGQGLELTGRADAVNLYACPPGRFRERFVRAGLVADRSA